VQNYATGVSAELALLFGQFFSQSPRYWLNLQANYDVSTTLSCISGRLASVPVYRAH
jgi:plasmid maintenance system antidote protein VapI